MKEFENKLRLKMQLSAIQSARGRLREALELNSNELAFSSIGELLLWLVTLDEWFCKHVNEPYKDIRELDPAATLLLGMRHALNELKHGENVFRVHRVDGGMEFPLEEIYTMDVLNYKWQMFKTSKVKSGKESQLRNFEKYLEGNDVRNTVDVAIRFFHKAEKLILIN